MEIMVNIKEFISIVRRSFALYQEKKENQKVEEITDAIMTGKLELYEIPRETRTRKRIYYRYAFRRYRGELTWEDMPPEWNRTKVSPFLILRSDIVDEEDPEKKEKLIQLLENNDYLENEYEPNGPEYSKFFEKKKQEDLDRIRAKNDSDDCSGCVEL
jgi:hypothetical protein